MKSSDEIREKSQMQQRFLESSNPFFIPDMLHNVCYYNVLPDDGKTLHECMLQLGIVCNIVTTEQSLSNPSGLFKASDVPAFTLGICAPASVVIRFRHHD